MSIEETNLAFKSYYFFTLPLVGETSLVKNVTEVVTELRKFRLPSHVLDSNDSALHRPRGFHASGPKAQRYRHPVWTRTRGSPCQLPPVSPTPFIHAIAERCTRALMM